MSSEPEWATHGTEPVHGSRGAVDLVVWTRFLCKCFQTSALTLVPSPMSCRGKRTTGESVAAFLLEPVIAAPLLHAPRERDDVVREAIWPRERLTIGIKCARWAILSSIVSKVRLSAAVFVPARIQVSKEKERYRRDSGGTCSLLLLSHSLVCSEIHRS